MTTAPHTTRPHDWRRIAQNPNAGVLRLHDSRLRLPNRAITRAGVFVWPLVVALLAVVVAIEWGVSGRTGI